MKRVTGIGGVFFKARDPAALRAWYQRHLGIDVQAWGGTAFRWADAQGQPTGGSTATALPRPRPRSWSTTVWTTCTPWWPP
jgi:hypothetical protein